MPYSKSHKNNTRQRILDSAYRMFIENGFEAITIKEIMKACELTHGAFYAHFSSKKELFSLAISQTSLPEDTDHQGVEVQAINNENERSKSQLQSLTFSSKIFRDDAMKNDPTLRSAYTQAFKSLCRKTIDDAGSNANDSVFPMAAMLIGAETLAQTVDDLEIRDRLIESCKRQAELLVQSTQTSNLNSYFWELTEAS